MAAGAEIVLDAMGNSRTPRANAIAASLESRRRCYATSMLRFSLQDSLIYTMLIAVGMGMVYRVFPPTKEPTLDTYLLWFGAGACVGAAILAPFRRIWTGVAIGVVVQLLLIDLLNK